MEKISIYPDWKALVNINGTYMYNILSILIPIQLYMLYTLDINVVLNLLVFTNVRAHILLCVCISFFCMDLYFYLKLNAHLM